MYARRTHGRTVGARYYCRTFMMAACFGIVLSPAMDAAAADLERGGGDEPASYESIIYGTVEKMPPERIGLWVIGRRDVIVTRETAIIEKHGKVAEGAFVEVEGNNTGKRFSASRMEVRRTKVK